MNIVLKSLVAALLAASATHQQQCDIYSQFNRTPHHATAPAFERAIPPFNFVQQSLLSNPTSQYAVNSAAYSGQTIVIAGSNFLPDPIDSIHWNTHTTGKSIWKEEIDALFEQSIAPLNQLIPNATANLTELKSLDLQNELALLELDEQLSAKQPEIVSALAYSFALMPKLKTLNLTYNNLGNSAKHWNIQQAYIDLISALPTLTNLKKLGLAHNGLGQNPEVVQALVQALPHMPKLRFIDISHNGLNKTQKKGIEAAAPFGCHVRDW